MENPFGTTVGYINFTGFHSCIPADKELYDNKYIGYIVSQKNENGYLSMNSIYHSSNISRNIDKRTWDMLPVVDLTNKQYDKTVFGVIAYIEKDDTFTRTNGESIFQECFGKQKYDRRLKIAGCGEGGIWVCNYNGNIQKGDYLTSSPIPGIGMKQNDDIVHNYTVGKSTLNCDFNPQIIPVSRLKAKDVFDLYNNYEQDNNSNYIYTNLYNSNNEQVFEYEYEVKNILLDGTIVESSNINYEIDSNIYKMAFIGCTYTSS